MVFLFVAVLTLPFWITPALTGLAFVCGLTLGVIGSIGKVLSK